MKPLGSIVIAIFIEALSVFSLKLPVNDDNTTVNEHLQALAGTVVDKYFRNSRCLTVIAEAGFRENRRIDHSVIHLEIDSSSDNCRDVLYGFLIETFEYKCSGYLVQLLRPDCALLGWFDTYKQKLVPRHSPQFLFLPLYPHLLVYGADLLALRQTELSANILVAEIDNSNQPDWKVIFSTNNFYEHPAKEGRQPMIFLDEWHYEKGFENHADLYPDKILDLKGKPFRVATANYQPFTSVAPLDGIENRIAILFCQIHNCTPVAVVDEFLWGAVFDNFTGNGVMGNVYNDTADVGTYAVYLWLEVFYSIDYSSSYLRGEVTVMLPRPERIGGWIVPFLPFKPDLWGAFFVSLIASTVFLFSITRFSIRYTRFKDKLMKQFVTFEDSSMRTIGMAVLQTPSTRLIGDHPNRYLFTSFEILYFVLSAMYSAELASFLTIPMYNPPIDKFHDFANSDIPWFGTHEIWVYALKRSPDPDSKKIVEHFKVLPMEELKKRAKLGIYGFTAERLTGGSITEQEHITAEVISLYHIMKESLFGSPVVSAIKKAGPYNEHYNRVINRAVDHGLTLAWEADTSRTILDPRIQAEYQKAKVENTDSTPSVIQMSHIIGILYLYALGIALSVMVFIAEVMHYRNKFTNYQRNILFHKLP